jgi:SAM-dependent methyltransferase
MPDPLAKLGMPVAERSSSEVQKAHYDVLIDRYERHATDSWTRRYRRLFIDEPLLEGIELKGSSVLEAMCGSGHSTALLLERGAHVTGLDVSREAISLFKRKWPHCDAVVGSILDELLQPESFDVVVVVGGLHHVHPEVDEAVLHIWKLLKPGGFFCFSEPHTSSLIDHARKLWYDRDPLFESNERAIDIAALRKTNENRFEIVQEKYFGNVAHTLVLNSMVLRVPRWLKRLYARPAMWLEKLLNPVLGRRLSCSVSCQWRRLG